MRKSLIALAALTAAGAVSAQSSVTLFGVVSVAVSHGSGSIASRTGLDNGANSSTQIGFRGVESLGGGMHAGFWLEGGINADDGSSLATNTTNQAGAGLANPGTQGFMFYRRSVVGIGGNWGQIHLGRDYAPSYWNFALYDPFGNLGVGAGRNYKGTVSSPGTTGVRVSNSIQYKFGHAFNSIARGNTKNGGFHGAIAYYMGENKSNVANKDDGSGMSGRIGYNVGDFTVALGLGTTKMAAGDIKQRNIGASYQFGPAKLEAQVNRDSNGALDGKGYLVGAQIGVGGAGQVRVSYSRSETDAAGNPTSKQFALGYVHSLSKRTALFATVARVTNSGGASASLGGATTGANQSSTGYDFGLRTTF